jgi:hypothetical protein
MRKLVESTLVSLDGVVGSPEEWALPSWPPPFLSLPKPTQAISS